MNDELKQAYILHNHQHGVEYVYLEKPTVEELVKQFYSYAYDRNKRLEKASALWKMYKMFGDIPIQPKMMKKHFTYT